jgi:AraC-like DNA-binding protein
VSGLPLRIEALFYREAGLDYHVDAHSHRIHQWFFCLHGGLTISVDGVFHELRPEDSLIIPPGAERETWCRNRAPGYLVTVVDASAIVDLAPACGRVIALPSVLREDLLALIAEVRQPAGPDTKLLSAVLVLRLLLGLCRTVRASTPRSALSRLNAHEHEQVVSQAEAFMQRNLYRPLRRAEIAAAVNLSEPHLGRLFSAVSGRSVVERLTELRMEQAKALLLESTFSVTQIAGEVGISSFSHFSKTFRQVVGVTPSDYRRTGGKAYA